MSSTKKFAKIIAPVALVSAFLIALIVFLIIDEPAEKVKPKVEMSAKEISRELGNEIAFISTESSTGSGLLLDDGYILTSQHVIDGFSEAEVIFEGDDESVKLPVYAEDYEVDLALIGPIKRKGEISFASTDSFEKGDELYLMGYPGESEDNPDTTITKGILSRVREAGSGKDLIQYLQTDAAIAGGQSGGVMLNLYGEVVGISGLSDDAFGYALASETVESSVAKMRKNPEIYKYNYPLEADDKRAKKTFDVELTYSHEGAVFYAYVEESTRIEISAEDKSALTLSVGDAFAPDLSMVSTQLVDVYGIGQEPDIDEFILEEKEGTYFFEASEDMVVQLIVLAPNATATNYTTTINSNIGFVEVENTDSGDELAIGKVKKGIVHANSYSDDFVLTLEVGKEYEISITSKTGAPDVTIYKQDDYQNDEGYGVDEEYDGLFDQNVSRLFVPKATGLYIIEVTPMEAVTVQYELLVKEK